MKLNKIRKKRQHAQASTEKHTPVIKLPARHLQRNNIQLYVQKATLNYMYNCLKNRYVKYL